MKLMKKRFFEHKDDLFLKSAFFLILLIIYMISSPAAIALEDSAYLVLVADKAGVAHPPGYPLYILLGKLFTLIPAGSIAERIYFLNHFDR